ncbi:MAG: type II toxin-antitoxin system VapC family toxin [Candidatus Promineifilaceae bacterium]
MIYLLDTHIILWSLFEPNKLSASIRAILENDSDTKYVSGVNLWEISLKYSLGKLELGGMTPEELLDIILKAGYDVLELESRLLATSYQLPKKPDHRDPFDRLLIWQAISNNYTLLSQDTKITQYHDSGLDLII